MNMLSLHAMHSMADQIRERARNEYVLPAIAQQKASITIIAGDLVRLMRLQNRVPAVCAALASKAFQSQNRLALESREGPPSGMGTRARFTFRLLDAKVDLCDDFDALRGLLGPGLSDSIERDRQDFGGL